MKSKSEFNNEDEYYEYLRDYAAVNILSAMMSMADNGQVAFRYFGTDVFIEQSLEKANALVDKIKK